MEPEKLTPARVSGESHIARVRRAVLRADGRYERIDQKLDRVLEITAKSKLTPIVVAVTIIGAFMLGVWMF